ncbi:hypothetical protein Ami103574_10660 [Aminipila butyrica]|uniref:Uncharacterized protein n=1 Tax=Aminipila butyrica TaxID=433296 RepID=A0A858BUY6_9FIRM|nr:hypothetical protein [Aminipila butyrica]QIB69753.1 hypothetical protein Ami103574_10660 [Aminipila butyrica]
MEINISGMTFVINETYGLSNQDDRDKVIAEKLAGIIIRDELESGPEIKTA